MPPRMGAAQRAPGLKGYATGHQNRASDLPGEDPFEARVHLFQVSGVATGELDGGRSLKADVGERGVHRAPIDLAFQQRRELGQALLKREILEVQLDDALAERADPGFSVSIYRDCSRFRSSRIRGASWPADAISFSMVATRVSRRLIASFSEASSAALTTSSH